MPPAALPLSLTELIEAADATGCRCMLFGEYTSAQKLVVFLPAIELAAHDTKQPACVICGMTLYWEISPATQMAVRREPIIGQMFTYTAHPHISRYGIFEERSFCRGSNTALMTLTAKSGSGIDIIGSAIVTIRDYYAGSSYSRALSSLPVECGTACRCMGGTSICEGCPQDGPQTVTDAGYRNPEGEVPCSSCGKNVSGKTVWVNGSPCCEKCAVVYMGVGYMASDCVKAAVNGGKMSIPKQMVYECSRCKSKHDVYGASAEYARTCPVPGCEARNNMETGNHGFV